MVVASVLVGFKLSVDIGQLTTPPCSCSSRVAAARLVFLELVFIAAVMVIILTVAVWPVEPAGNPNLSVG